MTTRTAATRERRRLNRQRRHDRLRAQQLWRRLAQDAEPQLSKLFSAVDWAYGATTTTTILTAVVGHQGVICVLDVRHRWPA